MPFYCEIWSVPYLKTEHTHDNLRPPLFHPEKNKKHMSFALVRGFPSGDTLGGKKFCIYIFLPSQVELDVTAVGQKYRVFTKEA